MDIKWIIGMLLVLMLVACAPQEAPPEETEPVDEAPAEEAPVEEEAPAEEEGAPDLGLDESKDDSGLDPAVVANWKKACLSGNAGLCAALERYGIDPNEGMAEEPAAEEETMDEGAAEE